ncbi:glycosyltransferase family 2 protein [Candidatus Pacearchaeota archaeon]|nr:glycosyltransferase family 2 protein [Candidatus Pacearchaeota archaeon]
MPIVKGKPFKEKFPLVSSIIPAYKEEDNIATCIEALLNQTYPNMEVIVVENGNSKDKTYEIAKSYEQKTKGKVRVYTIPGSQKGPGNALIYGFKKTKGKIISLVGADLLYGKDYISKGIAPILKGETVGTNHKEELCKNVSNFWARAFFYRRSFIQKNGLSKVCTLVRKDYLKDKLWDPSLGYADDQTMYLKFGTEFPGLDLEIYQNNPASFREIWEHSTWVGKSMNINPFIVILSVPFWPLYIVYKTIKDLVKDEFYIPFILFLPVYYSVRYAAYVKEAVKKLIHR